MSDECLAMTGKCYLATAGGTILGAGLGAAFGAMGGSFGSHILLKAGYTGYVVAESVKMGALGSGLVGAVFGSCIPCTFGGSLVGLVTGQLSGAMIGYGILHDSITMNPLQTFAASSTGAGVVAGTLLVGACIGGVIAFPCIVGAASKAKSALAKLGFWSQSAKETNAPEAKIDLENPEPLVGITVKR